jgi:hypothetical protein
MCIGCKRLCSRAGNHIDEDSERQSRFYFDRTQLRRNLRPNRPPRAPVAPEQICWHYLGICQFEVMGGQFMVDKTTTNLRDLLAQLAVMPGANCTCA